MDEEARVHLQVLLEAQQVGQGEEEGDEGVGGHEDGGDVNRGRAPTIYHCRSHHVLHHV